MGVGGMLVQRWMEGRREGREWGWRCAGEAMEGRKGDGRKVSGGWWSDGEKAGEGVVVDM